MIWLNELVRVIEFVKSNSPSQVVAMARLSLLVGEDINKVTDATIVDTAKLEKYKKAAETITGKKFS